MIDYKNKDLFWQSSVDKQLKLSFSGGDIVTNEDIYQESMEIKESLCSEQQLKFGCCEASQFKIKIAHSFTSHIGQTLDVSMTLNGDTENPFKLGTYKVASDKPTADRIYRDITAYDSMYDIIHADVSKWYESILPNEKSEVSLKEFRDSFFEFLGVEQEECTLVNDNAKIKRTINTNEALSGKEVVCAICEINGTFGHIDRNGKFKYVTLKGLRDTLYPASDLYPSEDLYPAQPMYSTHIPTSMYKSCKYEDFECRQISKLVIREKTEDLGTIYGDGDNTYIIQGNFLVFGKGADEMSVISKNIYDVIWDTRYLPANISAVGNPCIEVGDGLNLNTRFKTVYTYALQRTLKGIQALSDDFTATGKEKYEEKVNGTSRQIEQLTSRTRTLTQDVEKVESKFENYSTTEEMSSAISQSATEINTEVSKKVGNDEIISKINQSAEQISINANKINLNGYVTATDLKTGGKTTINGANITTGDISCDRLNGGTIKGQEISGGTITGTQATLEKLVVATKISNDISAQLSVNSGYGGGLSISAVSDGVMNLLSVQVVNYRSGECGLWIPILYGGTRIDGNITPYYDADASPTYLGTGNYRWQALYAKTGTIQTSDKNQKDNICPISDKYIEFFKMLVPVSFTFKSGDRTHIGFISQDVEEAMNKCGLSSLDFAGFCKDEVDRKTIYSLRYDEFIALNTAVIQKQQSEIDSIKREIEEMKSEIKELKGAR